VDKVDNQTFDVGAIGIGIGKYYRISLDNLYND
jgi:hypothetical protein